MLGHGSFRAHISYLASGSRVCFLSCEVALPGSCWQLERPLRGNGLPSSAQSRSAQAMFRPAGACRRRCRKLRKPCSATSPQYTEIRLCQCERLSMHCLRRLTPLASSNQQDSLLRRVQGAQLVVVTTTERRAMMQYILSALDFGRETKQRFTMRPKVIWSETAKDKDDGAKL